MRILVNLSVIQSGGGLQVAHSFLSELRTLSVHEYLICTSPNVQKLIKAEEYSDRFFFEVISPSPSTLVAGRVSRKQLQKLEEKFKPDIVFTLFGPSYWKPRTPHVCGFALAQHLYKESPYFSIVPFKERMGLLIREFVKVFSFKNHCDYWITETRDVANRLAERLQVSREYVFTVNNVYNGIYDEPFRWKQSVKDLQKTAKGFKLITISSFHIHKNLTIIPKVIDYLGDHYPDFQFSFILTVRESKFPSLSDQQKAHMLFLGPVALDECPLLYSQSDALFMPTLLECFTVSYLEAMKMGKPILTSDLPFARDICQDAALYFNSMSAKDIGEQIIKLANNKELQTSLIEKGYERLKDFGTATDRAQSYLKILEEIAQDKKHNFSPCLITKPS